MRKFSKLNVKLKDKSYPIFIGEDLIKDIKSFLPNFDKYSKIILVTDKVVLKNLHRNFEKSKNYRKKSF